MRIVEIRAGTILSRVLLVDDDLNLLDIAKVLLPREEPTLNPVTATSAQEALQKMKEEVFDAVVSDYVMPDMDGLEFLQTLRDEGNTIPFIIFTGQGREEVAMDALNLGANYYLMKGSEVKSTFGELAHIIRQVIQLKQTEDALILEREFTAKVINSLSDTFYIFDPEDGRAIRWNKVFEEIGGYSYEELKQNTPLDYYPPEEHPRIEKATREVLETGRSNVELTWITKSGRRIPFEYSAVLIKSPEGNPWICAIGRDITERKQAEAMLHESEGRYRALVENGFDGVFIHLNFKFLDLNQQFADMIGVPHSTLLGTDVLKLFPPESQQQIREYVQAGKGGVLKAKLQRSGGSLISTESFGAPCLFQGEKARIVAIRDISDREQIENELRASEEKFRRIVEDQTEFIVRWLPSGIRTFVNESYCRYLGKPAEELLGISFFPLIDERDLPAVKKQIDALSPENPISTDEHRVIRPDGTIGWNQWTDRAIFNDKGQIIEYQSVGRDITDQRQTEAALRESEERFRVTFQNAAICMATGDMMGRVMQSNRALQRLIGYSEDELHGKNFAEFTHPDGIQKEVSLYKELMAGKRDQYQLEKRYIRKDGQLIWVRVTASLVRDEQGNPLFTIGMVEDITDRKEAEAELRKFKAISDRAGYGIGIISPEGDLIYINNPFAQMHGYAPEELLGKNFSIFHSEEQMTHVGGLRNQLLQEGTYVGEEVWHKRKDGTVFPTLMNGTAIRDDNGKLLYLAATAQDITQWKQTSEKLMESEERFAQFMDHLPAAAFIKDSEGRTLFANQYLKDAFGGETWLGKTTSELFPSDVARKMIAADQKALNEGLQVIIEDLQDIHGAVNTYQTYKFPIARANKPKLLCGISINITERKQAEEALRESEQQFRAIFENVSVGMVAGSLEGGITATNAAFQEFLGYSAEELKRITYREYTHPEDLPRDDELFQERQEKKRNYYQIEKRYIRKDGQIRWGRLTSSLVQQESDSPPFGIGIVEDITERKQAEEALQESEALFQILLNATDDSVLLVNTAGMILAVNRAETQRLNKTEEELLGNSIFDHFPPAVADQRKNAFDEVIQSGNSLHHVSQDSGRVFESNISPIFGPSGKIERVGIFSRDITERKKAENALHMSEERFRSIYEQSPIAIEIYDREGELTEANPECLRLFGIDSLAEVKGFKLFEDPNLPTDAKERLLKGKSIAYEGEFDYEVVKKLNLYQTSKSGQSFVDVLITPLRGEEMGNQPSGYLVQVTDITERKQAEKAYQSVIESMFHGITIYQDGQFVFANRAMEEITGYSVEELLAFSPEETIGLVHPDDLEFLVKRQRDWLEGKPVPPHYSHRLIRKDGTLRWVEGFTNRVEFQGKPATQQTIIDISERKQAQELLQQQKKELSDFVHTMAHDLRSQLLSVEGYAEALQEECNQPFVEKIQYLAQHMGRLLRRSVALADAGLVIERTDDVNLTQLVQEISEAVIPSNIDFVVDDLPIIAGDQEKLAQVFQNLFENAVAHGNPTKITVWKQRVESGTEILITNNGEPIFPDHRSKIFQRGFSTQEERSGLGLAIVQKLVDAHGWQIHLADTPETAFIIRIPTKS